ncbi:hypothetical protein GJU40_00915 [Bacillus lacus]|uniref:Uncharacterized protein n=1 Tax=Metabacillus lacus TaxID=1983721 RepID=A0A7X2LVS9_9BACI|nr:hypothetical protein [Metabacillus lacus]MRX70730.1 hypothetical protein [Metabacillus lacus]
MKHKQFYNFMLLLFVLATSSELLFDPKETVAIALEEHLSSYNEKEQAESLPMNLDFPGITLKLFALDLIFYCCLAINTYSRKQHSLKVFLLSVFYQSSYFRNLFVCLPK